MDEPTLRARQVGRSDVPAPWAEPVLGAVWWTVGCSAIDRGQGTVVLALGLVVTGALVFAGRRRGGVRFAYGERMRLLRLVGITVVLIAAAAFGLGFAGLGELATPVACAIVGGALFPLSTILRARSPVAVGAVLMLVAAGGGWYALNTVGVFYPQGVVGLVAGAVLWIAGAARLGLIAEAMSGRGR